MNFPLSLKIGLKIPFSEIVPYGSTIFKSYILDIFNLYGFSRGTTARSVSLSWGAREVGSPFEWRAEARHCSRVMGGEGISGRLFGS